MRLSFWSRSTSHTRRFGIDKIYITSKMSWKIRVLDVAHRTIVTGLFAITATGKPTEDWSFSLARFFVYVK